MTFSLCALVVPAASAQAATASAPIRQVGSIDCAGQPGTGAFGTMRITRTGSSLQVSLQLTGGRPNTTFSVELWEEDPGCYPDNNGDTGVRLTTDGAGNGTATVVLSLPHPSLGSSTLGDGQGTENLVMALDDSLSQGAGDSYAAGPLSIEDSEPETVAVLGDSYTSGENGQNYDPATVGAQNNCHRSKASWGWQLAMRMVRNDASRVLFAACSGQTAVGFNNPQYNEIPQSVQLKQWAAQPHHHVDAVLISLGGNDADFTGAVFGCMIRPNCAKDKEFKQERDRNLSKVQGNVEIALQSLYAAVDRANPPKVYILGYPDPFPAASPCPVQAAGLSDAEQKYLSTEWLPKLNAAVRAAAVARHATFLDATTLFAGHEICTALPYVSGLKPLSRQESFHPTPAGYTAITQTFVPFL